MSRALGATAYGVRARLFVTNVTDAEMRARCNPIIEATQSEGMMRPVFVLLFSLFAAAVSAQDLAPDAQVKRITSEVIAMAKQDQGIRAGGGDRLKALIDTEVLPHFDFSRMTALAVGRNWSKASVEQQQALTGEFRNLLVRTYSSALSSYSNQEVEVKPLRAAPDETDVTVRTLVRQPGLAPISIDYSMMKTAGGWKVYDVVIGGISLVTNYRETFNTEIRKRGIDGLIKALASKNHSRDAQAGAGEG